MSSNDTASILSRLSLAPAGSFVVYDAGSGWCFTAHMDELHEAHVADIAIGAHPYAAVTLSHDRNADHFLTEPFTPLTDLAPDDILPADRDGISIVKVLADWMEWCDAVMALVEEWDGDINAIEHSEVIDAMRKTWRVTIVDADRLAEVNAAA